MFAKAAAVCAIALLSVTASSAATCKKTDPKVNECLRSSLQAAIRSSAALDPVTISTNSKTLTVMTSPEGPRATLSDYKVSGLKDVVVERASYTSKGDNSFEVGASLLLPKFGAEGMYTMQKGFFTANRAAAGPFTFSLNDYRIDFVFEGTVKNGFVTFAGKSAKFNGGTNSNIKFVHSSSLLNSALNAQPAELIKSYKAAVEQVYHTIAANTTNQLLQKVPFSDIFA